MSWFIWVIFVNAVLWICTPAQAQQYLIQTDIATCLDKSEAQCQALGCQPGTTYWWSCILLNDGTAAIEIQPGTPFDKTTVNDIAKTPVGLSEVEQIALQTKTQIEDKLLAAE